jgi:CheY-like chemotaxis protein
MKIFYADDDADDRSLFCEALQVINPSIMLATANDGEEAITLLHQQPEKPDLIFLDINMPKMDGRETLIEIRRSKHLKDVPVVIYSTHIDSAQVNLFNQLGVFEFLTKPNTFEALHKLLTQVLKTYAKQSTW